MLQRVNVGHKSLADYASLQGRAVMEEVRELARDLRGARVLHLSASSFGGGVGEILYTLVPLMRDAGLEADWRVVDGGEAFCEAARVLRDALQGDPGELDAAVREEIRRTSAQLADRLRPELDAYDVVIVHDPEPVLLRELLPESRAVWVWRCHLDLSAPNPDALAYLLSALVPYDATIFHMPEFVPRGAELGRVIVQPPAIDPLSPKNMALSAQDAAFIVDQLGIDASRPLLLQVARFARWKDPLGVIDAYRVVKEEHPALQLALIGSIAHDDPAGMECFRRTVAHAAGDPDVTILSNLNHVGAVEVNAFQVCADVVVQRSIREGFGLTVTEALWKARPVVAGDVGGIRSQIRDGETGFLVSSTMECARRCLQVLDDPEAAERLARHGKEAVRERFLTPRKLLNYLRLFAELGVRPVGRGRAEAGAA